MRNFDKNEYINSLLIRLKASDATAFADIYRMYSRQVHLFCCKSLSKEDAEEIVQNVFTVVWEKRHEIDLQYSFSSYLFSIAKHQVYNAIRSKVALKTFTEKYIEDTEEAEIMPEYDNTVDMMKAKLKKIIDDFPDRQREIFVMSRTFKLTYKEIAEKLGISENTVDTLMRRSLNILRKAFTKIVIFIFF